MVALVGSGTLTVGSVGDSRCVVSVGGRAHALTHDHKPDNPDEHQRIITVRCTMRLTRLYVCLYTRTLSYPLAGQ